MLKRKLIETLIVECMAAPVNTTGAAVASDWINFKNANRMVILIVQGAWAAGTPAVTLKQATDVGGGTNKALGFSEKFSKVALTGAQWTRAAVSSDTFNLPNTANTLTALELRCEDLDRDNGYACVQLNVASPGSNNDFIAAFAILGDLRYEGDPETILAAATV
jgi:hypothetical protein